MKKYAVSLILAACLSFLPSCSSSRYADPIRRVPSGTLLRCELMQTLDTAKAPQEISALVRYNFYSESGEQMVRKYTIIRSRTKPPLGISCGIPDDGDWAISVTTPRGVRLGPFNIQCESLQALSEDDDNEMRNLLPGIRGKEYLDSKGVKHWKAEKGSLFWIKLWQDLEIKQRY